MFKLEEDKQSIKVLFAFLLVAYIFSIGVRYIWVDSFSAFDAFKWNSELMINTNDGYFFAEGARDILSNAQNRNATSPVTEALSQATAFLAQVLPFSFEIIILWMSAVLGSLLVVPILLIAHSLKQDTLGFIAALIGSITVSYYNRTMVGYYDTDMLNIVLPMFVLWAIIHSIISQKNRYLVVMVLFLIISEWWYPKNVSLNTAMIFMALVYNFIFDRKNLFNYKLLTFALVGLAFIPLIVKLPLILALFLLFHYKEELANKFLYYMLGVVAVIYIFSGAFDTIWFSVNLYIINRLFADEIALQYFNVINTVREAGAIPFETFAQRISGATVSFIVATIGVVVMMIRYPIMIISLPMIAMGYMAYKAGLRFSVYAVPLYALGMGYVIVFASKMFENFIFNDKTLKNFQSAFLIIATSTVLYPNIKHVQEYKVPTVFNSDEVKVLDHLGKIASRDDYVVTWWDYGYPIRYYSDVNTLIDGGIHNGDHNFPVSLALLNDQTTASNISRLEVEANAKASSALKDNKIGVNEFLDSLKSKDFALPQKSRDIYLYLPNRMMDILPTVDLFANLDLLSGQQKPRPLFYKTNSFKDAGDRILLGSGIELFKQGGVLKIANQSVPLKEFIVAGYDNSGKLNVNRQSINFTSQISVIFMQSYNQFLVLDDRLLNSTYIKLFVLEEYDRDLYEPVIMSPLAKVYKLKR